ncbi:Asp-tRNA(Asn)/Glu-tRNA(Gln) amidotransferase subunit GatB [Candidatus Daviesbacteria bacterium]|nr:Asp-tRNA(Asn)/Glu-tRNA(Gln) amidotransferase subunit GatB [Candidatus Daviesbacteria bacterium]
MTNKYEPVIGLEIHVELNTKNKMFCRCSADYFGKEPNTHTCPVCLGLPGALPYTNKAAIEACIKIGLALNCFTPSLSRFERKNYFYPDLPKGYQISQYRWPLCVNGYLVLDNGQKIRINRAHQEEDTAKLMHRFGSQKSKVKSQNGTQIDFNRSGVPLVEIVTEPDFHNVEAVRDYAKKLQQLFRYLGVSNADMERGDMRLEANVSVRPEGSTDLPNYRVELKNINSFRFMVAAIEYEIKRQITALEKGEKISQETRGWDAEQKSTYLQRSKEEAHDYRYFPEPDLPELRIEESRVKSLESSLPELPWIKSKRFEEEYKLTSAQAKILTETKELADYFEQTVEHGKKHGVEAVQIANYIINKKVNIEETLPTQIIEEIKNKKVGIIDNEEELTKLAERAIKDNPKSVADYKAGKIPALQAITGGVMRLSSGKADVAKLRPILEKLLKQ